MKYIILLALVVFLPLTAFADTVHVEYSYDNPVNQAESFDLYLNGDKVCNAPKKAENKFSCDIPDILEDAIFRIVAVGNDGFGSPASAPYKMAAPIRPAINGMTVTYTIELQVKQ